MNSNTTLEESANMFLATFPPEERGKFSQELNRFLRWFGMNHLASSLTPPEVGNYAEQVARSGGEYLKKLDPVKSFLQYLKKQGVTSTNLSLHLKPPPAPAKSRKTKSKGLKQAKVLTSEGYSELKSQLDALKKEMPRLTAEISRAREDKDIRENAPLEAAREAQAHVQSKIHQLETTLKSAIIAEDRAPAEETVKATIGTTVYLKNVNTGDLVQYKLVDPGEADPMRGKISFVSPLGKSLLGKSPGDTVEVNAPIGVLRYQIETVGN